MILFSAHESRRPEMVSALRLLAVQKNHCSKGFMFWVAESPWQSGTGRRIGKTSYWKMSWSIISNSYLFWYNDCLILLSKSYLTTSADSILFCLACHTSGAQETLHINNNPSFHPVVSAHACCLTIKWKKNPTWLSLRKHEPVWWGIDHDL